MDTGTLWQRFHGELYSFLRARVPSEEAAQDLLQSAFLRAHRSLRAGQAPDHPRAWLYQIVRNLIVDARRSARRQEDLAQAVAQEADPAVATPAEEQEAFAIVARALPMFIEELDPLQRDALRMTELEGLTQAEAAERAGISLSGMKSRVQRGRKAVFDSLQRCCRFEVDARGHIIDFARRDSEPETECC